MVHSRGTVQSKTGVPVGTSLIWRSTASKDLQRPAHAVAGDAAAVRIQLGGERINRVA